MRVPRREGESARKKLSTEGLLDRSLRIRREGDHLLLPVTADPPGNWEVEEADFEERPLRDADYRGRVEVPEYLKSLLPTSFDVVGDIAVVKLPDQLTPYAVEVGRALREAFPRLRAVAVDEGVEGAFRVRSVRTVAGEGTETVHTEFGLRIKVDLAKAYFNPRLSNERRRVASLVRPGEVVVDMFAGVGPFSLMIARYSSPQAVYAVDINPVAIELLEENIRLNRAEGVVPIVGDAREVVRDLPRADRVIMNLPHSAHLFLTDALHLLKGGGTIHFYTVCDKGEARETIQGMMDSPEKIRLERVEELKTYSPAQSVYSADLTLSGDRG
ncbi:MAG: class I SAM-dependent methyltransferase [Methanomassiliicoccales archaeon]